MRGAECTASLSLVSRGQRLSFLVIALVVAVVAVVLLAGRGGDDTESGTSGKVILQAGSVQKIAAKEGETVQFEARNDAPEEVHVHGYDIKEDVRPGKPAKFSFKATITGRFEIELEGAGEQIGELTVEPK